MYRFMVAPRTAEHATMITSFASSTIYSYSHRSDIVGQTAANSSKTVLFFMDILV